MLVALKKVLTFYWGTLMKRLKSQRQVKKTIELDTPCVMREMKARLLLDAIESGGHLGVMGY